jgi:hypothetical protein
MISHRRILVGRISSLLRTAVIAAAAFALAGLALQFSPPVASADDGSVGGIGGDVYPLYNADIRMESETVQAVLYHSFADYQVDFKFVNDGPEQAVQLGFPFAVTETEGDGNAPVAFRAWQDGKPLTVTLGKGTSGDHDLSGGEIGYYLHEATFRHGTTLIRVSYLAEPSISAGNRFPDLAPPGMAEFGGQSGWYNYWLHTGAGWKGTIGKAVIRFQAADSFLGWGVDLTSSQARALEAQGKTNGDTTSPESYVKLDPHTYQWVFEDFEPGASTDQNGNTHYPYDINFAFTNPWIPEPPPSNTVPADLGPFAIDTSASAALHQSPDTAAGSAAVDGNPASAWGVPHPANGDWIKISLAGNKNVREIRVLTGNNKTLTSFGEYGRPKTLRVTLSDGTSKVLELKNEPSLQHFALSGTATWARVEILDIYPGTKSNDTYISEIEFGHEAAPTFLTYAELIKQQASPTTLAPSTTQGSATAPTESATVRTTVDVGTSAPGTGVAQPATVASTTANSASGNGGLPWEAIVSIAVAAVALTVLVFLVARLRAKPSSPGQ